MIEILAIDDDRGILEVIRKALTREGYLVTVLEDPLKLDEGKLINYQLILLDVMMPGIDGFRLCRKIRDRVDCPILFLTAKTEEKDLMEGLGVGGDDYITKPFGIGELRARVAAHLRREQREKRHRICIDDVQFSLQEKRLFCEDTEVSLTKAEYEICEYLALNRGQVFSGNGFWSMCLALTGTAAARRSRNTSKIFGQSSKNMESIRLKRCGG